MNTRIKASTCTKFPIGAKVKVTNKGQAFTTYKDMARFMNLKDQIDTRGHNPFKDGMTGTVVAKAMHEHSEWGEVLAVRVANGDTGLIRAVGVELEPVVVIGKPKLAAYDLAPLVLDTLKLSKYFDEAPDWATHVGSDSYGVHYFDHHPHVYQSRIDSTTCAFVKGLLPPTHKSSCHTTSHTACSPTLQATVIVRKPQPVVVEPTVEELKAEVATLKAKLWDAEWKLRQVVDIATNGMK